MNLIYSCDIQNHKDSTTQTLEIYEGYDIGTILSLQSSWGTVNIKRLQEVLDKKISEHLTDTEFIQLCNKNYLGDALWDYTTKALHFNSKNYVWVYAIVSGNVEAVCIVQHPKNSIIDAEDIFYVEYLAVAPWNRDTIFGTRKYKGIGTKILSVCSKEFNINFQYRCGFSLHSLSQALSYYIAIGMKDFGEDNSKEDLNYLEMDEINTKKMVASYGV